MNVIDNTSKIKNFNSLQQEILKRFNLNNFSALTCSNIFVVFSNRRKWKGIYSVGYRRMKMRSEAH